MQLEGLSLRRGDWGNRRALGEDEMGSREKKGSSSTVRVGAKNDDIGNGLPMKELSERDVDNEDVVVAVAADAAAVDESTSWFPRSKF